MAEFQWPDVGDTFNWAIDWFDAVRPRQRQARPGHRGGGRRELRRSPSTSMAAALRPGRGLAAPHQGVGKGDAVMRDARQPARAVGDDARGHQARRGHHADDDRRRGRPTSPTASSAGQRRFVDLQPRRRRQVRRRAGRLRRSAPGRRRLGRACAPLRRGHPPTEHPGTAPSDRLLLYFTSGTTSKPKLVEHTQVSYPVGHLTHDVLARPAARRRPPQHLLARAGPSTRGRASSRRGSPRRPCWSTTTRGSTPRRCCRRCASSRSPRSARRRRCGGC